MSESMKVSLEQWERQRSGKLHRKYAAALRVHLGQVEAQKRRTLEEWDAAYDRFLNSPAR